MVERIFFLLPYLFYTFYGRAYSIFAPKLVFLLFCGIYDRVFVFVFVLFYIFMVERIYFCSQTS